MVKTIKEVIPSSRSSRSNLIKNSTPKDNRALTPVKIALATESKINDSDTDNRLIRAKEILENSKEAKKQATAISEEAKAKKSEAAALNAQLLAQKKLESALKTEKKAQENAEKAAQIQTKAKEREEKRLEKVNNHMCITVKINGVEDNPAEEMRKYIGNYAHFPVSKINGVPIKHVIKKIYIY
jgi:hypothetical protein